MNRPLPGIFGFPAPFFLLFGLLISGRGDLSAQLIVSFTIDQPCGGFSNGQVTAQPGGGVVPYRFLWNTGDTTASLRFIPAGTYSVTITDAANGSLSASVTVDEPPPILVILEAGSCGAPVPIAASVQGGIQPYRYAWSTGETTATIGAPHAGTYCVTVTDAESCGTLACITLSQEPLQMDIQVAATSCPDSDDGSVQATATAGEPPYRFRWSTGDTSALVTRLPAGTYRVTVTDSNNCSASAEAVVESPPPIDVAIFGTQPQCFSDTNGFLTAIANGGTPGYTFLWSTGARGPSLSNVGAGLYRVTVTDARGCTTVDSAFLEAPEEIVATLTPTPESCPEANDGAVRVSATGGIPGYSYFWSNGASTATLSGLSPRTYRVTVTDLVGCIDTASTVVEPAPPFSISIAATNSTSCDTPDGMAEVTVTEGIPPFSYRWSTGATTPKIVNLSGGTYRVTVTNGNGCILVDSVTVIEPPSLAAFLIATGEVCAGDDTGQALVSVQGGTAPYSYRWNTGATTSALSGLPAGTYSVTVTDVNLCQASESITILELPGPSLVIEAEELLCGTDESSGSATVTASGGTPPYVYIWNTGATSESLEGIGPGTYRVEVFDANQCRAEAEVTVQMSDLTLDVVTRNVLCNEPENSGSALATAGGGTPPYRFFWSTGAFSVGTQSELRNLTAGTYGVTLVDSTECTITIPFLIEGADEILVAAIGEPASCTDSADGVAVVRAAGGVGPYSFIWSDGQQDSIATGLAPGTYFVTVTDRNQCSNSTSVVITAPPPLVFTLDAGDIPCAGEASGSASVLVSGGTAPYRYQWSNNQTTPAISGLPAGVYRLTVTDNSGCTETGVVEVNEPAAITVNIRALSGTCTDAATGVLETTASGGTGPYTFRWSTNATGATLANIRPGNYSVTVTDSNGCTESASITLSAFPEPVCTITILQEVLTGGGKEGRIQVLATGGRQPYSYLWSDGQTGSTAINLGAGTYEVVVTDANGCSTTCSVTLLPPAQLGDFVWLDADRDGIQDSGEPGIPGVTVIVQQVGEAGLPYTDTITTNDKGKYLFNLPPGTYKVTFVLSDNDLQPTRANAGTNDAVDSDADPVMLMTQIVTLRQGESNLTLDAGFFPECVQLTDPGVIAGDQMFCGPGYDPDPIVSVELPSGGEGAIEYLWMKSTEGGPFNPATWVPIPGATGPSFDPGPVYETTYFTRCARAEGCISYIEPNIVTIKVGDDANAKISGPLIICLDETASFQASAFGPGARISWDFGTSASPRFSTRPAEQVQFRAVGYQEVKLTVVENNCIARAVHYLYVSDNPALCPSNLQIQVDNIDDKEVRIQWTVTEEPLTSVFAIEHSVDGEQFGRIGQADKPVQTVNGKQYYIFEDQPMKKGIHFYRVRIEVEDGSSEYSRVEKVVLKTGEKTWMAYPNPVRDQFILEFFTEFEPGRQVEVRDIKGRLLQNNRFFGDRQELDFSAYPAGIYLVRVKEEEKEVMVLKVMK